MAPKIIILFGRSGCGKGTQAKLLQQEFGFDYLGTGDLVRAKAKEKDQLGQHVKAILEKGGRVETAIVFSLWEKAVRRINQKKNLKGIIFDGSPRSAPEAQMMDKIFTEFGWHQQKIFLLDISEQEAFLRLTKRRICQKCGRLIPWVGAAKKLKCCDKCGGQLITREDDNPQAVQARLDYFNKDVQPAVTYYQKQGRLITIDGAQAIDDVYQDIKKQL